MISISFVPDIFSHTLDHNTNSCMIAEQQIRQLGEANYNVWWPDDHDDDGIVCNAHKISAKLVAFSAVVYDDQLPVICNLSLPPAHQWSPINSQ